MFTNEEFEKATKELDEPDLTGYDFFTESTGVKIYRKYNQTSGLYSYKTFGGIIDVVPDICAAVYTDLNYRKKWDSYVKELFTFTEDGEEEEGVYWRVAFPFPLANRDYVFCRETREFDIDGRHIWVCLGRSHPFRSKPPKSGVVRVDDFLQSMTITGDGSGGTKAFMEYYDNPGGNIPTWLINWAAKTGVPGFLKMMTKACHGYPEYCNSKK